MGEEYERFEITDYDLENEFNPNRRGRRLTKKQQIYGVFNEDSDEDEEVIEMKTRRSGKVGKSSAKSYTTGIDFISGGIQQSGKKKEEVKKEQSDEEEEEEGHRGFGFGSKKDSSDESEEEVRPSFKPMETAGMRSFKGAMSNKGLGEWEQHTKGIGAKILLQMGFQPGKGLGKDLQGISAPVEAHVRKGRGAIGAYGPEKKTKIGDLKGVVKKEEKKEVKSEERGKQWSKKSNKGRNYKSVEDVIEKGKKPDFILYDNNSKLSKVTVIDMTGPEKRVLSGYHSMNQMKISEDDPSQEKSDLKHFQLPELIHNLNLIVNLCEQEIISNDKRQRTAEDRQLSLRGEKENLEKIIQLEKKYIETMEDVEELVDRLTNTDNSPTLEEAEKIFIELKVSFPNEFKEFSLVDLAPGIIAPLISASMVDWNPLDKPTKHVNVIKKWSELLDYSKSNSTTVFEPYPALLWSTVIPCFRRAANEWNPKINHSQMAALLDAWSSLLPEWMLDNILDQIVLNRLTQTVTEWDPLTDTIPIHTWIIPWSNVLGSKMHKNVYRTICDKLSKAFGEWHPSDRSAFAMIRPWKGVFPEEDLAIFLYQNVVPKLELYLNDFGFNHVNQDLTIFNLVFEWHEIISPLIMSSILDKYFFPKWMQYLVVWLNQSPNFDEVLRWCDGWRALISEAILRQPTVSEHLRRARELAHRALGIPFTNTEIPMMSTPIIDVPSISQPNVNLNYKEVVAQKCAERGIIFAPMPGRRENGKQVYRIGKLFCYFEKFVCCVSADPGNSQAFMPMSLNVILENAM